MKKNDFDYRCLKCHKPLERMSGSLSCSSGHVVNINNGVPIFAMQGEGENEYSVSAAVEMHENALAWLFSTFGGSEDELRRDLISKLYLKKGQRVLVTGVGAGNDLPHIAEKIGISGCIVALDYAKPMLDEAVSRVNGRYDLSDYDIEFCLCDATELPFEDEQFDAAYHFGGINLFDDIGLALSEMDRVVKEGGAVVVSDEGLAPWMRKTTLGKMLINNNPLYAYEAPLYHLPDNVRDVELSWLMKDCFYVISFRVSKHTKQVRLDVVHKGVRGGSIESRYNGVLEGVSPAIKNNIYQTAKNLGVSRVELIESLLLNGLAESKK